MSSTDGGKLKYVSRRVPEPPALDKAQRLAAAEKSRQLRSQRAELKRKMKAGDISLDEAMSLDIAQGVRVYQLVKSLPRIGPNLAQECLSLAGIPLTTTVRQMGPRQLEALYSLKKIPSPSKIS